MTDNLTPRTMYVKGSDSITRLVEALNREAVAGRACGLDTEFYNVDIGSESCVARSKLHFMSIAIQRPSLRVHPRGYHLADTAVLTREALDHEGLCEWLQSPSIKIVHNLPVDAHTLENEGIPLNGGINSLSVSRWAWPSRARGGDTGTGFDLDSLGQDFVGVGKSHAFRELFSEEYIAYRSTWRKVRLCGCMQVGCKRRGPAHVRFDSQVETVHEKPMRRPVPLETVVEGHPLWAEAIEYSARDAWLALAVWELAWQQINRRQVEMPW